MTNTDESLATIAAIALDAVHGGKKHKDRSLCFENDAAWYPRMRLPNGGQGSSTEEGCEAFVRASLGK